VLRNLSSYGLLGLLGVESRVAKKGEGRIICRKGRGFDKSWVEARLE